MRRRTATYPRALRVNQVLRQVLAEELERLADADELPMVTVTSVDAAPDMRTAVVYLATLDEATAVVLEERRVHLQRTVGRADDDEAHAPADLPGRPGHRGRLPGRGAAARAARGGAAGRRVVTPAGAGERRRERAGVTGLVVVDKEAGWTSHDVVARCRRIFGQRRVGHAGTLDPDATGVLLVGLGRATRLLRFLTALPKTYTTDIVLGTATSTLDASGEVLATYDMTHVTPDDGAPPPRPALTGEIEQVPPMVSAVKVGRAPAARAGPPGHRGGARRPAGDRLPLRHRARPGATGRLPGRGGVLVGHLHPGAGRRPRAGARRRGPRGQPAAHPHRLVRRRPTCARSTPSGPTRSSRRPRPCATSTP